MPEVLPEKEVQQLPDMQGQTVDEPTASSIPKPQTGDAVPSENENTDQAHDAALGSDMPQKTTQQEQQP